MKRNCLVAGVSPATVSLALRNSPEISEATINNIKKIADDLGYVQTQSWRQSLDLDGKNLMGPIKKR